MIDERQLEDILGEAALETNSSIGLIPDAYRELAYPVILRFALELKLRAGRPSSSPDSVGEPTRQFLERPPNEVIARIRPSSKTAEALLLVAHLEQGNVEITVPTVRQAFNASRAGRPANIADILGRAVRDGLLVEAQASGPGPKRYHLSISGWERVDGMIEERSDR